MKTARTLDLVRGGGKTLFTLLITFYCSVNFGQNTLPASGNVGIGTTSPTKQLQVIGETQLGRVSIMDSLTINKNVRIKDSLRVQKKLLVDQDVKIKGKTVMTGNVRAKSNLTVIGNTRTKGNEIVEGNTKILGITKMKGNAFVEGIFKLKGLADSSVTDNRFLMIRPNGKAVSLNKPHLIGELYATSCISKSGTFAPIWANIDGTISPSLTHGILYTGLNCPTWIGIGTDAPLSQFHATGSGFFGSRLNIGAIPSATTTAKLNIAQNSSNQDGITVNMTNSASPTVTGVGIKTIVANPQRKAMTVVDGNTNKDVFRVYGNGLIETYVSNPNYAFVVHNALDNDKKVFEVLNSGYVFATELSLTLNPFPDYVFNKDYDLISITELEKFINEEGHLPNIPSAEDVDKNGIGVGELQVKMLEKIEELTLYTIELNKKLDQLQKENEAIKTTIQK